MQVILLEDVSSLGKAGDLVKVADGFGRNYLIPQKKAILATEKSIKTLEHQKRLVQHRMAKTKKDIQRMAQEIESPFLHLCQAGWRERKALRIGHHHGDRSLPQGKRHRGGP